MTNNKIIGDESPRLLSNYNHEISIVQTTETKHWSSEHNKTIKDKAAYTWDNPLSRKHSLEFANLSSDTCDDLHVFFQRGELVNVSKS